MSYTFDASLSDDVSLVRFHIGDNNTEGYYLDDETIQHFVTAGSVGSAVVMCIKYIISQLSQPNYRLDWMQISDMAEAREGYEKLLKVKEKEFGISSVTVSSSIKLPYRADSDQDSSESVYDGTVY
jgi:hypothetical protein